MWTWLVTISEQPALSVCVGMHVQRPEKTGLLSSLSPFLGQNLVELLAHLQLDWIQGFCLCVFNYRIIDTCHHVQIFMWELRFRTLPGHHELMWYTYMYAGKTSLYIKEIFRYSAFDSSLVYSKFLARLASVA